LLIRSQRLYGDVTLIELKERNLVYSWMADRSMAKKAIFAKELSMVTSHDDVSIIGNSFGEVVDKLVYILHGTALGLM